MEKLRDDNNLEITIPTIRFLGLSQPTTVTINKAYLQLFVRLIVVYCTFLLFKPRLAKVWNIMFGDQDDARQREVNARIAKLESERQKATADSGKKSYAVATASAGSTPASAEKGGAKRRKA